MKHTIEWESYGKKASIIWEEYEHQFARFSPYDEFCCIFLSYRKLMGKPMHFPYDEVYRRMGIVWRKSTHTMGKVWVPISKVHPIWRVLLYFPILWEIVGETHAFPICLSISWDGNQMGKKELILWWKYEYQFPRLSPYHGFYCIFPYCGNLWGNPHISHMLNYTIGGNRMGKKYLYCGESMIIDFPGFPHTIGFVAFSRTVGNLWGNLCTSHTMTSFNCFLCYLVDPNLILMALYSCKELIPFESWLHRTSIFPHKQFLWYGEQDESHSHFILYWKMS